jgi:hypothetical protein
MIDDIDTLGGASERAHIVEVAPEDGHIARPGARFRRALEHPYDGARLS